MPPPISEEDKALFRQSVSGAKPLKAQARSETVKKHPVVRSPRQTISDMPPKHKISLSDNTPMIYTGSDQLFYCQSLLEKKHLRRFKQGELPIESRLDLHGHSTEEAKQALLTFLEMACKRQLRTLLIIHGKGQPNQPTILKNLIAHWLTQLQIVLAYTSAQPRDGGTGALYVLLKKGSLL